MYNYFKDMIVKKKGQKFRLEYIVKTRNYFLEEIELNELMRMITKMFVEL